MPERRSKRRKKKPALLLSRNPRRSLDVQIAAEVLYDAVPDGIVTADVKTQRIISVNPGACRLFGYASKEFLTKHISQLHPASEVRRALRPFSKLVRRERTLAPDIPCIKKDGTVFFVDIAARPIVLGKRQCLVGLFRDITERKRSEAVLRESEERYRSLVELTHTAYVILDPQGRVLDANEEYVRLTGHKTLARIRGRSVIQWTALREKKNNAKAVRRCLRKGSIRDYETAYVDRHGGVTPVLINATVIETKGAKRIFTLCHDVAEIKRAEERLKRSLSLERATLESTADGILVVENGTGKISEFNDRFVQLWNIPSEILRSRDDQRLLKHVLPQLQDPRDFLSKVAGLYRHPRKNSFDVLKFRNGRIIERYSHPQLLDGKPVGRVWSFRDVTERELIERELRESEVKFRSVTEQSPNMIFINQGGKVIYANQQCEKVMGYKIREFYAPRFNFLDLIHPGDRGTVLHNFQEHQKGEQVPPYEYRLVTKDREVLNAILTTKLIDYRGQKAILGIITDITERKKAGELLSQREAYLSSIIENQPGMVWLKDKESRLLAVNQTYAKMAGGKSPEEVVGKTDLDFWPRGMAGKFRADDRKVMKKREHITVEELISEKGVSKWHETFKAPVLGANGQVIGTTGYARDITERRKAEAALLKAKHFSDALINSLPGIFYVFNRRGKFLHINKNFEKVSGYSSREISKMHPLDFFSKEEKKKVGKRIGEAFQKGESVVEADFLCRDGKKIPYYFTGVRAVADNVPIVVGMGLDINERRKSEHELQASEMRYRRLFEAAKDGILILNAVTGMIEDVNPFLVRMLGYSHGAFLGKKLWEVGAFKDTKRCKAAFRELQTKKYIRYEDMPLETKDGRLIQAEFVSNVYPIDGAQVIQCNIRDITERRKAEETLRVDEEKMRLLFEKSPIGIAMCEMDGTFVEANQAFLDIIGYTHKEALKLGYWDVTPKEYAKEETEQLRSMAETGKYGPYEKEYIRKTGERISVLLNGAVVTGTDGVKRIWSLVEDITERKRAEAALRESEERFRKIIDNSPMSMAIVSLEGVIEYINKKTKKTFGYAHEEIPTMKRWYARAYPDADYRKKVIAQWSGYVKAAAAKKCEIPAAEYRVTCKDGSVRTVAIFGVVVSNKVFVMFDDVTERNHVAGELFKSKQMLQTILDTVPQRIFWKDRDSVYVGCNDPFARDCGYNDPGKLIGKTDYETASAANSRIYIADDRRVMKTGKPKLNYEEPQIKKDGTPAWLRTSKIPLRDQTGKVIGVLGTYEDITERKKAETALQESEFWLKESQRVSRIGSYVLDFKTGFWTGSETLDNIFGIGPDYKRDVAGWERLIHPEHRKMMADYFKNVVVGKGYDFNREYMIISHKTRETCWVLGRGSVFTDKKKRPLKMVGTIQDITARKRAEQALVESRRQLLQIIDTVPHMIFAKDQEGKFLLVNRAVAEMYGKQPKDLIGIKRKDVHGVQEEVENFLQADREVLATGRPKIIPEDVFTALNGQKHILRTIKIPFRMTGVKETCILGVSVDVTEHKKVEEFRNEIVRTVSHELRTPLSIEKEGISLLLDGMVGAVNAGQREILETVMRSIDRLSRMITSLLDISSIETGKIKLSKQRTDLADLVKDVAFEFKKRADEKSINFGKKWPERRVWILADPDKIMQALSNLVDNAIKFTPEGGAVEISLDVLKHAVECRIRDTGIGIAPENVSKMFEKFQQFSRTAGPGEKGFGLGLSITKGIIEMHGGRIWAHSELGKGTQVTFKLPLHPKGDV